MRCVFFESLAKVNERNSLRRLWGKRERENEKKVNSVGSLVGMGENNHHSFALSNDFIYFNCYGRCSLI